MSEDLIALSNAILKGEVSVDEHHPFLVGTEVIEVAPRTVFITGFSNACAFETDEGIVLIDTGGFLTRGAVLSQLRTWSDAPVHTIVYSHGHVDHVFGVGPIEEEARERGNRPPNVVAHANVGPRFDRYVLTSGYNSVINQRQFQAPGLEWPTDYRYPDRTYRDDLDLEVGGVGFQLRHAKGETDDHTWTWVAERRVLCCGDLFIWCSPNAGNPQKVQRYPREWAEALRVMAERGAEVLLPGHGLPVVGANQVMQVLSDTAAYLESIVEQTLALMNEGVGLDAILQQFEPPSELAAKPYLRPIYDEPEFIVRNVWRLYGGWYEGDPSRLKPPSRGSLAAAIAELAGGAKRVAGEARRRADAGDLRLACELIELAALASDDAEIHEARAVLYNQRVAAETSVMAKGVFKAGAEGRRGG